MRLNQKKALFASLLVFSSLLLAMPLEQAKAQTATLSVSPSSNNVTVGQTLTVHIVIGNVQNLYAVDIGLTWDTAKLSLSSNQSFVGVTHGVLNSPVLVVQDTASQQTGQYDLVATSENPAGPWAGTATVATLTFTVTHAGQSSLTLKSSQTNTPELASYVQPGSGTAENIPVTVANGAVTATTSSSSPSATTTVPTSSTPSNSPSSSPSNTTSSTPKVPEFPSLTILGLLVLMSTLVLVPKLRKQIIGPTSLAVDR